MVSQHGILLAVDIVSDHFGRLVAKVCDCLLRHGVLMLQEIVRRTELSPGQVKNSLLVLIQHNCVQAFSIPRGDDKTVTLYLAIFENVMHRLRFSKFLAVVRSDLPESEALLEGLLQNGRLIFDQLVERTTSKVPEGSIRPSREEIRMNFNKLVYARYVERCPKPEPFFDPSENDEQDAATRKRGRKTVEKVLSLEQKAINAAALSYAERFSEIPCIMEGTSNANHSVHHAASGVKRKHEALEVDEELNSTIAENEVLWRANFEKFIFCLKKKFCAERKKPKLRAGTHPIWEAFFRVSVTESFEDSNSVTSPIRGILERVGEMQGGTAMRLDQITRVLEELQCHPSSENPESFTLDLSKVVEVCQSDEMESLVKKKYGREAFTIFRLLVTQGHPVETDKIIDTTILEKKVVQGALFKLWNDEYIDVERVLSGTGSTQLFVWKVKKTFRAHFIDNLYHAALNLRLMISYIAELLLEGSKDEKKLRSRKNILVLALTRHDDSLMLFNNF